MHRFLIQQVCLVAALTLSEPAFAVLQSTFPITAQLPPVAYVSQPFEFTFLPNTFTGASSQISYAISNGPAWLLLDSTTRTFSGTPTANDVGATRFELLAFDQVGQASLDVTFVVLEQEVLSIGPDDILSQLSEAGDVSAPASLLLYPQQLFMFTLAPTLFQGVSMSTAFYAVSSDGSPLPSWVQFDSRAIRFSGTAPPLLSQSPSQQAYAFRLVASNVAGYSETSVPLQILIGNHHLAFTRSLFNYSTMRGTYLQTPSLLGALKYDNSAARRDQIASANVHIPSWLSLNETDLSFNGNVPSDASSLILSLIVDGLSANSANATIVVQVEEQQNVLEENLGNVSAVAGSYFTYVIDRPYGFVTNTNVAANSTNFPSWLSFSVTNLTLQGFVPTSARPEASLLSFVFSNGTDSVVAVLIIHVVQPSPTYPTLIGSSSKESGVPDPTAPTNSVVLDNKGTSSTGRLKIIIPVVVSCIVFTILLTAAVAFCVRRRKGQPDEHLVDNDSEPTSQLPVREGVSSEIEGASAVPDAVLPYKSEYQEQDSAPRVELSWAPDSIKRTRNRLSKRRRISHNSVVGSSWDDLVDYRTRSVDSLRSGRFSIFKDRKELDTAAALVSHAPQAARQAPARPARPVSLFSRRSSDLLGTMILGNRSIVQQSQAPNRLSGAGHGAGSQKDKMRADLRSSWQTTLGTIPTINTLSGKAAPMVVSRTQSRDLAHLVEVATRNPPEQQAGPYKTLRLVNSDSGKTESFGSARQHFYMQKTRDRLEGAARFSNAGSRVSSMPHSESMSEVPFGTRSDHLRLGMDKTPPIPQKSEARRIANQIADREHRRKATAPKSMPDRESSMASSRQFDSAQSSISYLEDENVLDHGDDARSSQRPTETLPLDRTSIPAYRSQVPSKPEQPRRESPQWPRLADRRKHISIGDSRLERSERSHKGSLRFV